MKKPGIVKSSGKFNSNALHFLITTPDGLTHDVFGEIQPFCKERLLNFTTLQRFEAKGTITEDLFDPHSGVKTRMRKYIGYRIDRV